MIRFVLSAIFMLIGLIVITISVYGNFKYSYILNRMQVASISDTLGAMFIILSLLLYTGLDILGIKLILVIAFLWFANPVASHFLARTEIVSDDEITDKVEVIDNDYL